MATIASENARQIRDPMIVQFDMEISEGAQITTYNPTSIYKSYDATLGNVWPMRILTDLQDEGFPLNGTCEWYEEKTASARDGKLGLRGDEGRNVTLNLVGDRQINNLTIGTQGVGTITYNGTTIDATGRDYLAVNATDITLTFTPSVEHGRAMVEFVFPGTALEVRNENLIRATVNLRCSLDPFATTLEASEINIEMWYPNDIGEMFKYIGNDWPITYTAGYSEQMSEPRHFYLSEQITWKDNVLTIRGMDAVPRLEESIKEGSLGANSFSMLRNAYGASVFWIDYVAARVPSLRDFNGTAFVKTSETEYPIRKECTMRDLLQRAMSLTQGLESWRRFSYIDAGWPTFQYGGFYSNSWLVKKEDLGNISETKYQNVEKISAPGEELYDEVLTEGNGVFTEEMEVDANQIVSFDYGGGKARYAQAYDNYSPSNRQLPLVSFTPSEGVFKSQYASTGVHCYYAPIIRSGGVKSYTNPNGLPGAAIEYDHFIEGRAWSQDTDYNWVNMFTPNNIFKIERDMIEFDYKGDPRWQPYDMVRILESTLPLVITYARITAIELTHEGGGTKAHVTAKLLSPEEEA